MRTVGTLDGHLVSTSPGFHNTSVVSAAVCTCTDEGDCTVLEVSDLYNKAMCTK